MTQLRSPRQANHRTRLSRRWSCDRGDAASATIMLVAVILAVLFIFHTGVVLYGRNVARAAAQDALKATQLETAEVGNGRVAAERTLELASSVELAEIEIAKGDQEVIVTVSGTIDAPLDGFFNDFEIRVVGPVERFYAEDERE